MQLSKILFALPTNFDDQARLAGMPKEIIGRRHPLEPHVPLEHRSFRDIDIEVDAAAAKNAAVAKKLTEVCPVAIFAQAENGSLRIQEENLDECVLCDLCLEAAPKGSVRIVKLYE